LAGSSRLDDRQLLSAYTRGDEAAFEALVKQYFGLVYAVALRQVRDTHLAEEAAQSTFIILARKAGSLSDRVPLCGWLLRTARFVCKDALKTQRRRLEFEQAFEVHLGAQTEPDGDSVDAALLEEALLALSASDQTCVLGRFFEGRTVKEVGKMLGISEGAAQKKISRGLQKMRRYLLRRGAKPLAAALPALLATRLAPPAPEQVVQAAVRIIHAAAQGKLAGGTVLTLAGRCLRSLTTRGWAVLVARLALPVFLLLGGGWASWSWSHASTPNPAGFKPSEPRVEALGKAWSRVVLRAAVLKHKFARVPGPNDPEFQAFTAEVMLIDNETTRISGQFYAGLDPARTPEVLAEFLTVEMRETLELDAAQQAQLLAFMRNRLSQGPGLKEAEKAIAKSTRAAASQIKAGLPRSQQQLFDRVYGADGMCLFQFIQLAAAQG